MLSHFEIQFRREREMKKERSVWEYFWYALYAFAGLGAEIVLIGLVEPALFGKISISSYTAGQSIIHWLMTILCWGTITYMLVRCGRTKLDFQVISNTRPSRKGILLSGVLVLACITANAFDWGVLKVIGEWRSKDLLLFSFQYIYYIFEVMLVLLIVVYGQKFAESLMRKRSPVPWGGLLLCCTWGMVHILSKGSIKTGIFTMLFSILFGEIYILLERNTKYSYLAIALAFMI